MTPHENKIRDRLAENLGVLDEGLELIDTEYKLPNALGGKGFIDILARDRFGTFVVIEIKRSDVAARQAAHEIFKYTALLRTNHGLTEDGVRCIVLSTDWHELLVPFSELVASVSYHVDGYRIAVDEDGSINSLELVEPAPEEGALELCPSGLVFLYTDPQIRTTHRTERVKAAEVVGIGDYILIEQDHVGSDPRIVYPYADCLWIATLERRLRANLAQENDLDVREIEEIERDGNPWYLEETLLNEMAEHYSYPPGMDVESMGPDKFRANESNWPPKQIRRFGARMSSPLRTDEDLLAMVRSDVGGHSSLLRQIASPRIAPVWQRVRQDLDRCLLGNARWTAIVNNYLDEIEAAGINAVALEVFNPLDLPIALFKVSTEGSAAYFPTLQIVAEPDDQARFEGVLGGVAWDGTTVRDHPQEMLDRFFDGDIFQYFLMRTVNEVWQIEDALLAWHGLYCEAIELSGQAAELEAIELNIDGDRLIRNRDQPDNRAGKSLADFAAAHRRYLEELASLIQAQSIGL